MLTDKQKETIEFVKINWNQDSFAMELLKAIIEKNMTIFGYSKN